MGKPGMSSVLAESGEGPCPGGHVGVHNEDPLCRNMRQSGDLGLHREGLSPRWRGLSGHLLTQLSVVSQGCISQCLPGHRSP